MSFLSRILFKPEKFDIVCHNEKEWNDMQLFLFERGYYWENYGKNGWHIDHIIPCSFFILTDYQEQKFCFHYTNLQPFL